MTSISHIAPLGVATPKKPNRGGHRLAEWWRAALERIVPHGYEDETGFHFGSEPGLAPETGIATRP